jgi:hypothetical protein
METFRIVIEIVENDKNEDATIEKNNLMRSNNLYVILVILILYANMTY